MRNKQPRGSKHYCAKLDENTVRSLRETLSTDNRWSTIVKLASCLGVSYSCVYDVYTHRTWKHIVTKGVTNV